MRTVAALVVAIVTFALFPAHAAGAERLCDPAYEDCRQPIIDMIRAETVGIDVSFWFMEDSRYASELISRKQAGVPVQARDYTGVTHEFFGMGNVVQKAKEAETAAAQDLKTAFTGSAPSR